MNEIQGSPTQRQQLEAEFDQINPNCHCTQSKVLRRAGVRLVLEGCTDILTAKEGLTSLMEDCPRSKAVGMCCDVVQKCTKLEFIQTDIDGLVSMAEASIAEASTHTEGEIYE